MKPQMSKMRWNKKDKCGQNERWIGRQKRTEKEKHADKRGTKTHRKARHKNTPKSEAQKGPKNAAQNRTNKHGAKQTDTAIQLANKKGIRQTLTPLPTEGTEMYFR